MRVFFPEMGQRPKIVSLIGLTASLPLGPLQIGRFRGFESLFLHRRVSLTSAQPHNPALNPEKIDTRVNWLLDQGAGVEMLRIIGEQDVPLEKLPQKLAEVAVQYKSAMARLSALAPQDRVTRDLVQRGWSRRIESRSQPVHSAANSSDGPCPRGDTMMGNGLRLG